MQTNSFVFNDETTANNNINYVGFPVRLVAYIIDLIIIAIGLSIIKTPMFFMSITSPDLFIFKSILFKFSLIDIILYLLSVAYFVITQYYLSGTLGKKIMKIKLASIEYSSKIDTIINLIYRETIGRYLSSLLFVGYLLIFSNDKKQGLHDMLCDTVVVYDL